MHTEIVSFELGEALIHLQDLIFEFRNGHMQPDDDPARLSRSDRR